MSDPESPEEETTAEPVKVKQVAIAAGIVTAALTAAVAFTVAGPLGVGVAAAGVAGIGHTAHRIRNPKTGRPGVLHSWLTRTRRTKGTQTWPFTGSQQKRALTRSGRAGGQSSRSKLPSLTSTRAKRSAALAGSRPGGPKRSTRSGIGTTPGRRPLTPASARKTTGSSLRTGRPGSKPVMPAKLASSKPGVRTRSGRAISKGSSPLSPKSLTRRPGSSGTRRTSGGTAPKQKPRSLTGFGSRRRTTATGRTGLPTRGRSSTKRGLNPWQGTRGGRSLGGRSTGSRKTGRGQRLGGTPGGSSVRRGPLGRLRNRVTPDRNRNRTPNRTALRPRPYARKTAGSLWRTSLRLPVRSRTSPGARRISPPFRRPTKRQAIRARRTLRLRSGVHLRHAAKWVLSTPQRRWDRLWNKLPKAPLPLTHYTERAGMKTPTGPKYRQTPVPVPEPAPYTPAARRDITLIPITRNGETIYVSSPIETILEAFQQLAAYHPSSAREVEQVAERQADMFAEIGKAYNDWATQLTDGQPFEQAFADSIREIGVAISATGSIAQNAHQTFRAAHAADIARYEDPRPDEGMWNGDRNR